jgi:hypothetical protein
LTDEQVQERFAKLRRRNLTLLARYREQDRKTLDKLEGAFQKYLDDKTKEVKEHVTQAVAPLVARSEGRIPPRRPGQTAAERRREIDAVLPMLRALKDERKQCAEEERREQAETRQNKRAAQQEEETMQQKAPPVKRPRRLSEEEKASRAAEKEKKKAQRAAAKIAKAAATGRTP